ncbi:hypothetical protein [Bradyrhizobium sp. B120]
MKTVWIYTDAANKVGDEDYIRVFATIKATEKWFADNDPEGVAFE